MVSALFASLAVEMRYSPGNCQIMSNRSGVRRLVHPIEWACLQPAAMPISDEGDGNYVHHTVKHWVQNGSDLEAISGCAALPVE
jgi:hypothetical protein